MKSLFLLSVFLLAFASTCHGQLRKNFYRSTCPNAEQIVKDITTRRVRSNPVLPAKLIRMHFHDCIVRGCDASVLINSTSGNTAEKDAPPNLSLGGFDVIEEIKAAVELQCPGVVSCADILTLATRDAVSFPFQGPLWEVRTGRRDGRVSISAEASAQIPGPADSFAVQLRKFTDKGLTEHDLVVLSGAHTIGEGQCFLFNNRLYNFTGRGDQDPALDPAYANFLKTKCSPSPSDQTRVAMDPDTPLVFDNNYYKILLENKGMFFSDSQLLTDRSARVIVNELTNPSKFFVEFAQSMERMARVGVVTGTEGEIREKCGVINPTISMVTDM